MLIFPALGGGSKAISGVGMMFLIFGLVSLRRPS
jgi:hypothetical protein